VGQAVVAPASVGSQPSSAVCRPATAPDEAETAPTSGIAGDLPNRGGKTWGSPASAGSGRTGADEHVGMPFPTT